MSVLLAACLPVFTSPGRYVPYGPVHEVMPYLIRRVQENSSMVSDTGQQQRMLAAELGRRARRVIGLS
jgi:hypothetical protein